MSQGISHARTLIFPAHTQNVPPGQAADIYPVLPVGELPGLSEKGGAVGLQLTAAGLADDQFLWWDAPAL